MGRLDQDSFSFAAAAGVDPKPGLSLKVSHPFPMSLFSDLPRPVQDEYSSLKQSLRRGGDATGDARE